MRNHQLEEDSTFELSHAEAPERLKKDGYNELPSSKGKSIFATATDVAKEPMFILLFAKRLQKLMM